MVFNNLAFFLKRCVATLSLTHLAPCSLSLSLVFHFFKCCETTLLKFRLKFEMKQDQFFSANGFCIIADSGGLQVFQARIYSKTVDSEQVCMVLILPHS